MYAVICLNLKYLLQILKLKAHKYIMKILTSSLELITFIISQLKQKLNDEICK